MVSSRTDIFLNNFHYLNKRDHRAGCLPLGRNKALTAELETIAKNLRASLKALDNEGEQFLKTIRDCFNDVEAARTRHGKAFEPKKNSPYSMFDNKYKWKSQYVIPYQPGRFEKELAAGLTAVAESIDEAELKSAALLPGGREGLERFKQQCEALAQEIQNFKQKEKDFAEIPGTRVERPNM